MNKKLITMLSALSPCITMTAGTNKNEDTSRTSTNSATTANPLLSKSTKKVETIGDIATPLSNKSFMV